MIYVDKSTFKNGQAVFSKRTLDSGEISNSFVSKFECGHQNTRCCIRLEPNCGQTHLATNDQVIYFSSQAPIQDFLLKERCEIDYLHRLVLTLMWSEKLHHKSAKKSIKLW